MRPFETVTPPFSMTRLSASAVTTMAFSMIRSNSDMAFPHALRRMRHQDRTTSTTSVAT